MSEGVIDEIALLCPLCEYDLRATIDPRCPECGHAFDRAELLQARVQPTYLFDQQQRRIFGPLFKTWLRSLAPQRFWLMAKPQMRPVVRRLILYWVLSSVITNVICAIPLGILAFWNASQYLGTYGWGSFMQSWFVETLLVQLICPMVLFLLWPWLTILAMNVFRATLKAGAIRQGHLIRWAIYTTGFNLFLIPVFVLVGDVYYQNRYSLFIGPLLFSPVVSRFLAGAVVVMPIYCVLLTIAYRRYLRLPQPVATVLLNQVVVWLAFWAMVETIIPAHL